MNIEKLAEYAQKPALFAYGSDMMWTDPHISRQLLPMHIDSDNDLASRSGQKIDATIDWILSRVPNRQLDILDLGCGPGLYAEKLAGRGHRVTGVDFSANSIDYATRMTENNGSHIEYHCRNYLDLDFIGQFDLVILIYLDFCVLRPEERNVVLQKVFRSIRSGGSFIFDVDSGNNPAEKTVKRTWEASTGGFWSPAPYLALTAGYDYPEAHARVDQHVVLAGDESVRTFLFWTVYYQRGVLPPILEATGFVNVERHEGVLRHIDQWFADNVAFYQAVKP